MKVLYWCVLLLAEEAARLRERFAGEIDPAWTFYAHHMTIRFGAQTTPEIDQFLAFNEGREVELALVSLGRSDGALALGVESVVPTLNKQPHITLATAPGVKPVASNAIEQWAPLPERLVVRGRIEPVYAGGAR